LPDDVLNGCERARGHTEAGLDDSFETEFHHLRRMVRRAETVEELIISALRFRPLRSQERFFRGPRDDVEVEGAYSEAKP
jgi:hypothetical protein